MAEVCKFFLLALIVGVFLTPGVSEAASASRGFSPSPEWVAKLSAADKSDQLFVVAGVGKTTAWVSLHEKDAQGNWRELMTTPGFIGREGLGKTKEGDAKTPVGVYHFTEAFGIAADPGSVIPYKQVDDNYYWSGDVRPGMRYNEMVDIRQMPNLDRDSSEHIVDYNVHYQHCLNISYNKEGKAGLGSAIFLHCLAPAKPFTGGCVAIPQDKLIFALQRIRPSCAVVIDSMENLGAKF